MNATVTAQAKTPFIANKKQTTTLVAMIACFILVFGTASFLRQYNFQTQTWDMGVFAQTMWNSAHGRWMQNNLEEAHNHLGVHMSPFCSCSCPATRYSPVLFFSSSFRQSLSHLGHGRSTCLRSESLAPAVDH